jgi:two-component sensor histidine kinase
MKQYLTLILVAVMMAFLTGYYALFIQGDHSSTDADEIIIATIKFRYQKNHTAIGQINLQNIYNRKKSFQLVDPLFSMPQNLADSLQGTALKHYSKTCKNHLPYSLISSNMGKAWIWEEFLCGKRSRLPFNFFDISPFMHPSGKSYAFLAMNSGVNDFMSKDWILNNLAHFHALELDEVQKGIGELNGSFKILADLENHNLKKMSRSENSILSKKYYFSRSLRRAESKRFLYNIYDRKEFENYLRRSPYKVRTNEDGKSCFFADGGVCWEYNAQHLFKMASKSTKFFFIASVLILIIILWILMRRIKLQRLEDDRRRLALQVLTHEFRTPVSSLLLNIDTLGKEVDKFDDDTQEILLRISNDIYRLKRLTETSKNYLKLENNKELIQFNYNSITSINGFISDILEIYKSDLSIQLLKSDNSMNTDTYWLGICLKNLVENALTHGKSPVEVKLKYNNKNLQIEVVDSGECQFTSLSEMTSPFIKGQKSKGTGIGLNIVNKVIKEMGGKLSFKKNPSIFTLTIKDVV